MLKRNQGITLIALVVTIIVLLILAGVTLSFVAGENGILKRATIAVEVNEKASAEEEANLVVADIVTQYYEEKYVNHKEVGELDNYIENQLATERTTEGNYTVKSIGKDVIVFKDKETISTGVIINGRVEWNHEIAKLTISKIETEVGLTNAKVNIELQNGEGAKITYAIKKAGDMQDKEKVENQTELEYEFSGLETGMNYTITVEAENQYGKATKIVTVMTSARLRNKWNLGVENSDLETYRGNPEYKGEEEGLYLNNSILATTEDYILNDEYTVIIETKNIGVTKTNEIGCMVSTGFGRSYWGSYTLGICKSYDGNYGAASGAGDNYYISCEGSRYTQDEWHISAIKYDGQTFSYWVDGTKVGESGASNVKVSKLYIGGMSNSGTTSSGVYWGYASGYYRNLAVYEGVLTDEQLKNYSF